MTNHEENYNSIPFSTASKRTKYSEINVTEALKDLYIENYKE